MRKLALAFALLPSLAFAQNAQDIQLKPGLSGLWGAQYSGNVVHQFNTASPTSVTDSFRWYQGVFPSDRIPLLDLTPTGAIFGAATGGSQGAGTVNATGFYVNGATFGGTPGGSSGQIQYNNAGAFGGFTTSGDATINTGTGALTLATVNGNVGSFGSATNCVAFTTNAKGLITAASATTCTPAVASITGLGTGVATALGVNVGTAGSVVVNGGALGTPSSGTGTNLTGIPIATGISGLGAGCATWLATPSSANLRGCLTDETGTGIAYFVGGALGTPSSATLTNATGLRISTGVSGLGTGVATALGVNVGSAGAPVLFNGALGTPTSGVATNITGLNATQLTTGTIPAARTNGHQNGTATNDNAAAGEIGEYISSSIPVGSAVSLTSGNPANITSVSLTAGDWDVCGNVVFQPAGGTTQSANIAWISTTSAALPTLPNGGAYQQFSVAVAAGLTVVLQTGCMRQSLSGTTTVYLSGLANFAVSTETAYGFIGARRAR